LDLMDDPGSDWRIEQCSITDPDAAALVEEVQLEYVARYGSRDDTPLKPGYFEAPGGAFFVGYLAGVPIATGAWRRRSDVPALGRSATAEIKRMYVAVPGRGRGLARAMLAHLEVTAAAAGAEVMILETGTEQPEALGLYASAGYVAIPGFGFYRDSPLNRCLARPL
jgi:GNAT superfamily N-acetyltransferase